jgi:benzoylformate decarboxylase
MGWGMAGAIGAKLAAKARPVVAVIGDGSAMWNIQSLWTAAHYDLAITYIICANQSYNQVRLMKHLIMGDKARGRYLGTALSKPRIDFSQLACSMGVHGERVEHPDNLVEILHEAIHSDKPRLVEVYIDNKP